MTDKVDYLAVGRRIRAIRLKKGLTQTELSAMVNCSNNHLSHIETAQCKASLSMILRISAALDVSMDYFFLDTAYARSQTLIDTEIAEKLQRCSPVTLVAASRMLDILLDQQEKLRERP